jgi:hypothetical protein
MVGDSRIVAFRSTSLRSLRERGLDGVRPVIADRHSGLVEAARKAMPGAGCQRCRVHFLRNVFAVILKGSAEMAAATIRTIFAHSRATAVRAHPDAVVDRLTFNGTIIETGTDSYRLATIRARTAEARVGRQRSGARQPEKGCSGGRPPTRTPRYRDICNVTDWGAKPLRS